jgi:hypothetical protein
MKVTTIISQLTVIPSPQLHHTTLFGKWQAITFQKRSGTTTFLNVKRFENEVLLGCGSNGASRARFRVWNAGFLLRRGLCTVTPDAPLLHRIRVLGLRLETTSAPKHCNCHGAPSLHVGG